MSVRRADLDFDVTLFREHLSAGRLEEALALYQGDFLATVGLAGAREFEQWAEGLRQQLAAERRQLLRTLVAKATDHGQWSEAARYVRGLIEEDPMDLDPRLRLVELMALSGDLVGAQVTAGEIRRLAAETQGKRLPEAIETAIARALLVGRAPERRQPAGFPRHPDMVGRATESRRVVERWKAALEGRGGCVLISGEPGSGKTRLLRELERRLRRDRSLVLTSACHPPPGPDRGSGRSAAPQSPSGGSDLKPGGRGGRGRRHHPPWVTATRSAWSATATPRCPRPPALFIDRHGSLLATVHLTEEREGAGVPPGFARQSARGHPEPRPTRYASHQRQGNQGTTCRPPIRLGLRVRGRRPARPRRTD
ncbi:MAG: AAA family ATPase [Gemmatimonadetes bacterium]|nr:AAA family ATPase [Gemmatimonadota bacterium]